VGSMAWGCAEETVFKERTERNCEDGITTKKGLTPR